MKPAAGVAPVLVSLGVLLASGCGRGGEAPERLSPGGALVLADVERFVEVLPYLDGTEQSCRALDRYLADASPGLKAYLKQFDVDAEKLCVAIRRRPEQYARIPGLLPQVAQFEDSVRTVYARLTELVPGARWPDVYFVVGTGVSAGSITGGRHPRILIGAERLSSVDGLSSLIAHEAVHTQQRKLPGIRVLTGGPRFLRATVLQLSIREGAADFVADLVAPRDRDSPAFLYGEAHEEQLWREFQRDMLGREHRLWVYNGWNREELGERPPDLGYYVGYRIVQAYYERAEDKQAAIREILDVEDYESFLRRSGYDGGAGAAATPR